LGRTQKIGETAPHLFERALSRFFFFITIGSKLK